MLASMVVINQSSIPKNILKFIYSIHHQMNKHILQIQQYRSEYNDIYCQSWQLSSSAYQQTCGSWTQVYYFTLYLYTQTKYHIKLSHVSTYSIIYLPTYYDNLNNQSAMSAFVWLSFQNSFLFFNPSLESLVMKRFGL